MDRTSEKLSDGRYGAGYNALGIAHRFGGNNDLPAPSNIDTIKFLSIL